MKKFTIIIFIIIIIVLGFFFVGQAPEREDVVWGVNFSQKHSEHMGLDWKANFLALINDLGVKNMKIGSYWDLIEKDDGEYDFNDLDWQVEKAEENGVDVILTIGMKAPRWPECHIPEWAKELGKREQQEQILELLEEIILRYKDSKAVSVWQVENEPFFPFGECPWADKEFLKEEIVKVKSLDSRPVLISDSGEGSFWFSAASLGDIVGTTLYRKVWFWQIERYVDYPLPPVFYWRKAQLVDFLFDKEVICVELQAEPWGPELLYVSPVSEQEKTMNLEQFRKNVSFAQKTGLKGFYLWGSEWWYWMKEVQQKDDIWQEARKLF